MKTRAVLVAIAACAACACGSTAITADRVERAIEPTFANLVAVQVSRLKLPPLAPSDFDVAASCRRVTAGRDRGSGEWMCHVRWLAPDRQPLKDAFDVVVTADGCYTASAEGEQLGGATLRASDGSVVRNLLRTFEGCFDTM